LRVLLDECVPRRLARALPGHEVRTVPEMGWAGMRNGALLEAAAGSFEILVTVDQRIRHQQRVYAFDIAVIVLVAPRTKIDHLLPLVPEILRVIARSRPGNVYHVPELSSN
jgi:hypothetical protein